MLAGLALPALAGEGQETISLSGQWRFQLDRGEAGVKDRWFDRALPDRVRLPGSLPGQGIGDEVAVDTPWIGDIVDRSWFTSPAYEAYRRPGHIKVPFWLQPDRFYTGPAWFQRDIDVPPRWKGQRLVLFLERPHWKSQVWVDGRLLGQNLSLSTPHEYDLGTGLAAGRHTVTICVDNRMVIDIGCNSHSISDHTQGSWNGIVGRIELRSTPAVWVDDLQVYPHVAARSVGIKGRIGNATARPGQGTLRLAGPGRTRSLAVVWDSNGGSFETEFGLGEQARLWDEFSPSLIRIEASLDGRKAAPVIFGLREVSTQGTQFVLNGRKVFFRGTLECAIFPKTGHPPTDEESWRRIIRIAKAHGLNMIRFHSWCPPEAAFAAADDLGFYYQVEVASWANGTSSLGDGKPVDQWLNDEAARILKAYGNHPSFLLMPYGNEPGGQNANAWLVQWVNHWKAADPRRLYTSGSGWPQIPENQFHVTADPRIQAWGAGLKSRINSRPPETVTDYRDYIRARSVPVISHEIGQWCVYPNLAEIPKYTGYLKCKNFEIFRDSLAGHGMLDQARQFLFASGRLQALCYKEDIESALRTPGMGGFQLLDLHDFPGQGTALVGVLDPFWGGKGYISAAQYRRFCGPVVLLARLGRRVFTGDEALDADIEVANFGAAPLEGAVTDWRLVADSGRVVAQGRLAARTIPVDNGISLGHVKVDLGNVPSPSRFRLVVGLQGTRIENDWDIWVYPPRVDTTVPSGIRVSSDLDGQTLACLAQGGKVLLMIPPDRVRNIQDRKVELGFSSIFWNTAWTGRQPPTTLGILCDPKNPALAGFPTDSHTNWQWWYLIHRSGAMILDDLPPELHPLVQVIDDWVTNHRLGLAFEARVAGGRLLVSSMDLQGAGDPVRRQMLHSLVTYMSGDRFEPRAELTPLQIRSLYTDPLPSR
jgi:hypothetical protein